MKRTSLLLMAALAALPAAAAFGADERLDVTMRVLEDVHDVNAVIRGVGTATDSSETGGERALPINGGGERTGAKEDGRGEQDAPVGKIPDSDSVDDDAAHAPAAGDDEHFEHAIEDHDAAHDPAGTGTDAEARGNTPRS